MKFISAWDFVLVPVFLLAALIISRRIMSDNIDKRPEYQYYVSGLMAKIFGGIALGLVYIFYYNGGDTITFWTDSVVLSSLMFHDFSCWIKIVLGDNDKLWFWCFDPYQTGIPYYYLYDARSYAVARYLNIISLIGGYAYFPLAVLTAWFSYTGVWRLYEMLVEEYPELRKSLAYAVLFVPSVLFWGSGVMKDTITFSAACWFTYAAYKIVLKGSRVGGMIFSLFLAAYVMISIRPYIFVALMPGVVIWTLFNRMKRIDSVVVKLLIGPIVGLVAVGGIAAVMSQASENLGDYGSVDMILEKAVATQQDLKREAYEGNSFDIGDFEPTIPGIMSKLPVAIWAGMFRPTIFDVKNVVMFLSALENLALLLFTIRIFFLTGPIGFFKSLGKEPTALFMFVFALFFAFSVGLTTSNFGSLVRYKIPSVPFFLASLLIIRHIHQRGQEQSARETEQKLEDAKAVAGVTTRPGTGSIYG